MSDSIWSEILSGAAGALIVLGVQKAGANWRNTKDAKSIYEWMLSESAVKGSPDFRSTRAIASHTNLTEDRVRDVCSTHAKIHLSTGAQADLWTLKERVRDPQHQMY